MSSIRPIIAILVLTLLATPLHTLAQERKPTTSTELWVTGDDGLTQRFAQALTTSLSKSKVLSAPTSNNNDGLVLTIPSNLYWQEVGGNTNFQYVVIFTDRSSKYLGISIGACWENGMSWCADTAVGEAEKAWSNRLRAGPNNSLKPSNPLGGSVQLKRWDVYHAIS